MTNRSTGIVAPSTAIRMLVWLTACVASVTVAGPSLTAQTGQTALRSEVSGRLHAVWPDHAERSSIQPTMYVVAPDGSSVAVSPSPESLAAHGGWSGISGRLARVVFDEPLVGRDQTAAALPRRGRIVALVEEDARDAVATPRSLLQGTLRYVVLLCRFSDSQLLVPNPQTHYASMLGGTYPGLDHYWNEVSFGQLRLTGSAVEGWFDMPGRFADYWLPGPRMIDIGRVSASCAAAADPTVDFAAYQGVIFVTPKPAGVTPGPAIGGGYSLNVDGQQRTFRTAWIPQEVCGLPGCASISVVAHELGHSFELPHSSGPYGRVYDSGWDVMSGDAFSRCESGSAWWCIPPHPIGYHKALLGWIPPARLLDLTTGTALAELAPLDGLTPAAEGTLLARIGIPGSSEFYTVEARRAAGYDQRMPRPTVVMHRVDPARRSDPGVNPAWVVDGNNTDPQMNPNDAEAMLTSGESFVDAANGILVDVLEQTTTGWSVALTSQTPGLPLASADRYRAPAGAAIAVPAPGVLVNDHPGNAGSLTASLVHTPLHGRLVLRPDGSFTYAPDAGFVGTDSFTYNAVNASGSGNVTTARLLVSTLPTPPTNLVVEAMNGQIVTLRWRPPTDGEQPSSYVLEGGLAPGQTLAAVETGSAEPRFTLAVPPGTFFVRMRARTAGQITDSSNEIQIVVAQPRPPSPPSHLIGLVNGDQLSLAWQTAYESGAPEALRLDVSGTVSASIPLGTNETFSYSGVPAGTYTFSLRASNRFGTSGSSNAVTLTFPRGCSGAPLPPDDFVVYRRGNIVDARWNPAASGVAPTSYLLSVAGAFTGVVPLASRAISAPVPAGSYTLSVRATNPCGSSAPSPERTVVVP